MGKQVRRIERQMVVPGDSVEYQSEMERWWIGELCHHLVSRLEPMGMREVQVEGSSVSGWMLRARHGDGMVVEAELELDDVLAVEDGENWQRRAMEVAVTKLVDAVELLLHPPEPAGDGPMVGLDGVGVQVGVEILDKLGESGLQKVKDAIHGEKL